MTLSSVGASPLATHTKAEPRELRDGSSNQCLYLRLPKERITVAHLPSTVSPRTGTRPRSVAHLPEPTTPELHQPVLSYKSANHSVNRASTTLSVDGVSFL